MTTFKLTVFLFFFSLRFYNRKKFSSLFFSLSSFSLFRRCASQRICLCVFFLSSSSFPFQVYSSFLKKKATIYYFLLLTRRIRRNKKENTLLTQTQTQLSISFCLFFSFIPFILTNTQTERQKDVLQKNSRKSSRAAATTSSTTTTTTKSIQCLNEKDKE